MCGIVAVLPRRLPRQAPAPAQVASRIDAVAGWLGPGPAGVEFEPARLEAMADAVGALADDLQGAAGVACLLAADRLVERVASAAEALLAFADRTETRLDRADLPPEDVEAVNAALVRLRDHAWSLGRDRARAARAVTELSRRTPDAPALDGSGRPAGWVVGYWAVQAALAALDRLEVRGRDSAGLLVLVDGPGQGELLDDARLADPLFRSLAIRRESGRTAFVYKAAAEIGELGDNTRALRAAVAGDALLAQALARPGVTVNVLAHTRWASVGSISEVNAHPLDSNSDTPFVAAALNGDVDNHHELRESEALSFAPEITTDAKVIPTLIGRELAHVDLAEAFRRVVNRLQGSVAVAAVGARHPDRLSLAIRGSGQALYVGLGQDSFVVASEVYGLVEETGRYLRLDGEAGEVVVLDQASAGSVAGIVRTGYDATPRPVTGDDLHEATITTRDIDRRGYAHFLLKEINEAPSSLRKTLRGRVVTSPHGQLLVRLGADTLPEPLVGALRSGRVRQAIVIGQGTAAVAGQAVAQALRHCLPELAVAAEPATELSGFELRDDMSDTLIVAVSQSGTTTDTNRTVDLARARGAWVVAIVNRRNSDLTEKAHGVLYTSDGRDVEMSVASTKAFYAQVAAGHLLALGLADVAGRADVAVTRRLLAGLRALPDAMERVLADRPAVARAAGAAPAYRSWSVVGSGPDRVAAAEIRIKLSELCYKSIACDATEDKKHIDLSSEPLVLVCASSLVGATADDVAKEVAIYRAHKALPVVIAAAGEGARFAAAHQVIEVPATLPELSFVLAAMVGHLFGYEAALAIDAQARPLRSLRGVVEAALGTPDVAPSGGWWDRLGVELSAPAASLFEALQHGEYNGHLEVATALRLVTLLRYATRLSPIDGYEVEFGRVGSPVAVATDLLDTLSVAIGELTRPIDAIKHQAKTVTVGISRREDDLVAVPLVREALATGLSVDALGYRALRALAALDPAVEAVNGYSRYRIEWSSDGRGDVAPGASGRGFAGVSRRGRSDASGRGLPGAVGHGFAGDDGLAAGTISLVDQGGVAQGLRSRTVDDHRLRGTKHRVATEREVTAGRGRSDGRTVIFLPESRDGEVVGMTLLHVRFADRLPPDTAKTVLSGFRGRYAALTDAVTETEAQFDDRILGEVPIVDLLSEPVYVLAEQWRQARA